MSSSSMSGITLKKARLATGQTQIGEKCPHPTDIPTMIETYQSECEYCTNVVDIPLRVGPWQGWLPAETFLCDECFELLDEAVTKLEEA